MIEVTLSQAEEDYADEVARKRNAENRRVGRKDALVNHGRDSLEIEFQGARSELAVSKALKIPWNGQFFSDEVWKNWKKDGCDVGNFEVRSTHHPSGRLILHPKDRDNSPYILVLTHKRPIYQIIGWCLGKDGKTKANWWQGNYGRPCYYVAQNKLLSLETLPYPETKIESQPEQKAEAAD